MCDVCRIQQGEETGKAVIRPEVKHAGRNIFWVFQGKGYQAELMKGYLWAPMMDKSGNSPAHWTMLENVKEGDIIFHGVAGGILAISVACLRWFESRIKDGIVLGRQVNCKTIIVNNSIILNLYKDQIVSTCSKFKYQPFDKNGDGRQGYLFDLNDKLAGIFARELVKLNPNLVNQIEGFSNLLYL